ncbi:hypothetical protein CDL15_Pgr024838 [Punica granatum]|uniref:DHHA2 domain-containing protein n=1 Tax=Punica granatum TaxID=22663 RepID=A0A218WJG1_PUNGR|nr:hypothetical protein CDL15_Pgr024838 [Punica granatum]
MADVIRSSKAAPEQEPYVHSRDNPYFNGLSREDTASVGRGSNFDYLRTAPHPKISRSVSDMGDMRSGNFVLKGSEDVMNSSIEESDSDVVFETFDKNASKNSRPTSFSFPPIHSDLGFDFDDPNESEDLSPEAHEETKALRLQDSVGVSVLKKTYSICRGESALLRIPLPQSAASFYIGYAPLLEIVESCESITMLNSYLKETKKDVNAGAPGRFLHVVLGQDVSDASAFASTIMYAFYLYETFSSDQLCTVPVINMRRADLSTHAELKWLLSSCQVQETSLIFIDEIDLSYYDLYGSLKLVLLNGHKLHNKLEALKGAVVEIFNCRKGDSFYPWVKNVTVGQDCSCCTLLADKFAMTSAELLTGQGFSRLLLAGILLDTGNLTHQNCTSKDKYMATLLLNGAGRFGCDGLYQILRYKTYDISDLKVADILRKDFKKWSRVGNQDAAGLRFMVSHIGMSSIGISISQLLAQGDTSAHEIKIFQQLEKVRLLAIVSGYYDSEKNFKREILVSSESAEIMKNLLQFFNVNASQLPMKTLALAGLMEEMRAFEIDRFTSRKSVERLLEEFSSTLKG